MLLLAIALVVLQLLDIILTYYGIHHGHPELNPVAKRVFKHGKFVTLSVIKVAYAILLSWLAITADMILAFVVFITLSFAVVVWNSFCILHSKNKRTPTLLHLANP